MPSSAEHRAKYEANRQLLDTGNNGAPLSTLDGFWAATVAFYAALHLVDRLAARVPYHPGNHGDRMRFVSSQHRAILTSYNARIGSRPNRAGMRATTREHLKVRLGLLPLFDGFSQLWSQFVEFCPTRRGKRFHLFDLYI